MQLDLLDGGSRPTAQELWDWQANVRRGVEFLQGEKHDMVDNSLATSINLQNIWYNKHSDDAITGHADQIEGNGTRTITFTHANSNHFNYNFGGDPTNNNKSFMDASWIKNYNGSSGGRDGYPGYYYVLKQTGIDTKPFWDTQRTNSNGDNYVGFVSGREE
jgi:hypothetical protein